MNRVDANPTAPLDKGTFAAKVFDYLRKFAISINQAADGRLWNWVAKTGGYASAENELVILIAPTAPAAVTLPDVKAMAQKRVIVKRTNNTTHTITVAPAVGTIDGAANATLTTAYQSREFFSDGTSYWLV